ncbi:MAG: hypothetical protein IJA80_08480 [Clostridia bacterium]|nr:hypothetical protein [Clostridia bacterium]
MKKAYTKVLSIILSLAVIITCLPLIGVDLSTTANAKTLSEYEVGDIIEFGSYPQSEVTDESLLKELNSLTLNWVSYNYYVAENSYTSNMIPSDYMKYADVTYNCIQYRAVKFTQYRQSNTRFPSNESDNSYQDENGYYINNVYWFKYEPLEWRVLDPEKSFVMCESIIDAQPFNNTAYLDITDGSYYLESTFENDTNSYATSLMRSWLNNDFYNTAFSSVEQAEIQYSTQDNSCFDSNYPEFDSDTTYDKVFLLSYDEVTNSAYGFSLDASEYDSARAAQGTDYARVQGLYTITKDDYAHKGDSQWWLRSPDRYSGRICTVFYGGYAEGKTHSYYTYSGIRPAIYIDPSYIYEEQETENSLTIEQMTSQIRFDRNADNSYANTFDVRTRVNISDEDFIELVGATNEEAIENIDKVGFVYTIDGENFSAESAQTVAQGGTVSGYVDAPVKYIQDADGYYMFTCLVTDVPENDKNYMLTAYAYICVNGEWYFSETPMNADFNSLYATYYPVACEKYGW